MTAVNSGRDAVAACLIGEGSTYGALSGYIGVGDSSTAVNVSQTDLVGTNKYRKPNDVGYPARVGNVVTFRASFTEPEAAFAWNEWALFNAADTGSMLNRKVSSMGTKPSNEQWRLTVDLTITIT